MDPNEAADMLGFTLDKLSEAGEVLVLADAYERAHDPEIKARTERALNDGIEHRRVVDGHGRVYDPILTLMDRVGLAESTYVIIAGALGRRHWVGGLLELREKSGSEKVREACDEAMVAVISALENAGDGGATALANFGEGEPLPERVGKERDAALIRIISRWEGEAKKDKILSLGSANVSPSVKDAAAAALSKLDNIAEAEFSGALDVLATCGKLDDLADAYIEARLPRTKELIQTAVDKAMDVAACLDWREDTTYNGHACSSPSEWYGQEPFKQLLQTDCPDSLKQKARRILEEGGSLEDPCGLIVKASENRNKADSCLRRVRLYLLQERHRNRDQILEGATVEPPARGTASPAGRTMQHRRIR